MERTSYERQLPIKLYYEAKDKEIVELEFQHGLVIKINEKIGDVGLESIIIEAISKEDVTFTIVEEKH